MTSDTILIRGAQEHNLKNIDLELPRGRLILFTGVSGSGKSSLAFDTLYAEGQRRYVESLSTYARQFLGQLEKPRFTAIKGLSPTIAIQQGRPAHNPRSTVGTLTEIADFLRVLFARVGRQYCSSCDQEILRQSAQDMVHTLLLLPEGTRFSLLSPMVSRDGTLAERLREARRSGFVRVQIDGQVYPMEGLPFLDPGSPHRMALVVDRLVAKPGLQQRLTDSIETALKSSGGRLVILHEDGSEQTFTEHLACPSCGIDVPEKGPQLFSFNHPKGMCPDCEGLGMRLEADPHKVVPDPGLSIREGAITPWANFFQREGGANYAIISAALEKLGISLDVPFKTLSKTQQHQVLYGEEGLEVDVQWKSTRGQTSIQTEYEGPLPQIMRRLKETKSEGMRREYMQYLSERPCPGCSGHRLRKEALSVRLEDHSIADLQAMPLGTMAGVLEHLSLSGMDATVAAGPLKETHDRLRFLINVGLDYLSLDRAAPSLSGGELQRIRLASQIGSELTGVIYVLDEPSIGLHPRDNARLLKTLRQLKDLGNTVLVVEHDREAIEAADYVVDFGPGAGQHGGEVLYSGDVAGLKQALESRTGGYLSRRLEIEVPSSRRPAGKAWLEVRGATQNNLQDIDVAIPLGCLVAVTGVSGAGKSSLVNDILRPALANQLNRANQAVGRFRSLEGVAHLDKVIHIDQAPIGRSPRSSPATYVKALTQLRTLFAKLPEAKLRGFGPNRFSYNVKGGRCEACQGEGFRRIEMHFLADVEVRCEVCEGRRYNEATLEIRYKGWSIADMLEKSVDEVYALLRNHRHLSRILFTLVEVGLGYISLGQSATTLSGGEAQRIKLARELARSDTGRTLYLLDEPTTGLHFDDVSRLIQVLERLVDAGNTVLVVEHNVEVLKRADWIIDLGPEGGEGGGQLVAVGTPETIARCQRSHTGQAIRLELASALPSS